MEFLIEKFYTIQQLLDTIENRPNNKVMKNEHAFRKACSEAGIDCLCSYRTIERISKLENVFNNLKEILNISLVKGLSENYL